MNRNRFKRTALPGSSGLGRALARRFMLERSQQEEEAEAIRASRKAWKKVSAKCPNGPRRRCMLSSERA